VVTVQRHTGHVEFEVWSEPPALYLDHWALRRLSEDAPRCRRFLDAFSRRGTLYFSLMNVVEIAGDQAEERIQAVRSLLEGIGPHWLPMTMDPTAIIQAEEEGRPEAWVSDAFLKDPAFASRLVEGEVSLVHTVDLTRGDAGRELRENQKSSEAQMLSNLGELRKAHGRAPHQIESSYPRLPFQPQTPMLGIYNGLVRLTVSDGFTLNGNHVRDLYHACNSVRCADMVTLDGHWAGQVAKLRLPDDFVKIYTESTLDSFLADLEAAPATR